MKVAFWSNSKQCGVTSNLAAISVASVIRFPYKLLVLENHLCSNNLGCSYPGKGKADMVAEVGTNYYEGGGSEGLIRRIYRSTKINYNLEPYLNEIIDNHLYYMPQGQVIHSDLFDYEFSQTIEPFFNLIDDFSDITFIDTASSNSLSTKNIIEEAELIVVNLYQDMRILDDFFKGYSSYISKAIILISKYSSNSLLSIKRISKMYDFPMERILPIPYNDIFKSTITRGRVVEFICSHYDCRRDDPNFFFIQSLKKAAYLIVKETELIHALNNKELIEDCRQ